LKIDALKNGSKNYIFELYLIRKPLLEWILKQIQDDKAGNRSTFKY